MAFDITKISKINQISGGISESSGLWTLTYTGVIADLSVNSTKFKDYLDLYGITNDDWLLVKLPVASSMGIVVVTTVNAKLKLLAFV